MGREPDERGVVRVPLKVLASEAAAATRGGRRRLFGLLPPARAGRAVNAWQSGHDKIAHSKVGKWRAAVLIGVHVAIAVHIVIWYFWGMKVVSPVEPSESMQTLREGIVNAGFVFFALAIVSTLILGRWFCGWGCHIVALQDLCSWLMLKIGVRPKPFRSRLLVFVPLVLAIYMFVWPVVHREVIRPMVMDERGRMPTWLGQSDPIPGVATEFLVEDFWSTFAPWYIAIPFVFVCTFGAVYFLGSKGFCTYGCPYGGIFGPSDLLAPGKIRVTDACNQCGHCTAVCTSNVRVHEEVRDFGAVVDPGCMKCYDCVSVCPNDALYFGLGRPTVLTRPRSEAAAERRRQARAMRAARYDLKLWEEWAVAGLFLLFFLAYRGMMNQVPMLMAVGMAGIMSFCAWKLWTMRPVSWGGTANSRLQSLKLRYRGRWRPWGYVLAICTVAMIALAVWSGTVRALRWQANHLYSRLSTPLGVVLRPGFQATPEEEATARESMRLYRLSADRSEGGFGWRLTPDEELNLAYMQALLGDLTGAEQRMEYVIRHGKPYDSLVAQAAQLIQVSMLPQGRQPTQQEVQAVQARLTDLYELALKHHPRLDGARMFLSQRLMQQAAEGGDGQEAAVSRSGDAVRGLWDEREKEGGVKASTLVQRARIEMMLGGDGHRERAMELLQRARAAMQEHSADDRLAVAGLAAQLGDRDLAAELALEAARVGRKTGTPHIMAAGMLASLGRPDQAADLAQQGIDRVRRLGVHSDMVGKLTSAAGVLVQVGKTKEALPLYREALDLIRRAGNGAWELHELGKQMISIGHHAGDGTFLMEGIKACEDARDLAPGASVIRIELAEAYASVQRYIDAERELTAAATIADRNAYAARYLSAMLLSTGKREEGVKWEAIAIQRERAAAKPAGEAGAQGAGR